MGVSFLGAALLILGWLYVLRYVFQYEIGEGWLRVKLLGHITLRRVRLADIQEVRLVSSWAPRNMFSPRTLFAEAWPSFVFTRRVVLVVTTTGISRRLVLSPRDPDSFVREISEGRDKPSLSA